MLRFSPEKKPIILNLNITGVHTMNPNPQTRITPSSPEEILSTLTLEEKASLCSGRDFWNLKAIPDKGVPSIMLTDGPHGLRKQEGLDVGFEKSVPATCFPTASALASSWDPQLIHRMGVALGEECRQEKVAVLLGPGVNIKRSPLCGRNFEYFSEDPLLSGTMAAAWIQGVQSQGVGTSLKHFAVNNQERRRMVVDAQVDQRALREIYLPGFERAVKEGQPDTVMCAYNKLNGHYCSEHNQLLSTILKEEWGHEGLVVSDWGATNERVAGLEAGLELEMPSSNGANDRLIVQAVRSGKLAEQILDTAVLRILKVILKTHPATIEDFTYNKQAHHELAREVLTQSMILLKNREILPLKIGGEGVKKDETGNIAIIGEFAKIPRYQGSGSSLINPHTLDNAWDAMVHALKGSAETVFYARGYDRNTEDPVPQAIEEAVALAQTCQRVIIFAGLPDVSESEGFDRQTLHMPPSHNDLIEAVAGVNPNVIVVLSNGSPVTMPWLDKVQAVLETYLGGQAWGSAVVDVLLGRVNPSGKLAETFPLALEHCSATPNFPGGSASVSYSESIYVGYRYYSTAKQPVLFPFGFGLSYTSFAYSNLILKQEDRDGSPVVLVRFDVTNTGKFGGKEVAQVYLRAEHSVVFRPDRELKGFQKVHLEPGETREVQLILDSRSFAFWDGGSDSWCSEAGAYEVLVGSSSEDILLTGRIDYPGMNEPSPWARELKNLVPGYYAPTMDLFTPSSTSEFAKLLGREPSAQDRDPRDPFTRTSTLEDAGKTLLGRLLLKVAQRGLEKQMGPETDRKTMAMLQAMIREMPLRNIGMLSGGKIPMRKIDGVIALLNRRILRGLWYLVS